MITQTIILYFHKQKLIKKVMFVLLIFNKIQKAFNLLEFNHLEQGFPALKLSDTIQVLPLN